jgi:hypothetical protein
MKREENEQETEQGLSVGDIEAIRERAEKATEGPWKTFRDWPRSCHSGPGFIVQHDRTEDIYDDDEFCYTVDPDENEGNDLAPFVIAQVMEKEDHGQADAIADFIAHARTDIPALLDEVESARRWVDKLLRERDDLTGVWNSCENTIKDLRDEVERLKEERDYFKEAEKKIISVAYENARLKSEKAELVEACDTARKWTVYYIDLCGNQDIAGQLFDHQTSLENALAKATKTANEQGEGE